MRGRLTLGFFLGFLFVSLFGCADNRTSYSEAPNRPQENMNTRGLNPINANSQVSNENANMKADTKTTDTQFINQAAQGGMAEIQLGKLAATKAQSAEVRQFAQKMVADHTKANNELNTLARQKNYTLPTNLAPKHQSVMDRLNGLAGADFDQAYVEAMVDDHEETVELFKDQADGGSDADLKAWAGKMLPALQTHLEMIKGIQSKIGK